MKMPSYLESRVKAYGRLEELQIDPKAARTCTPGWNITIIASMPQIGIKMKIKLEVILRQQTDILAGGFLEVIDDSLKPVTGSQMIMREQAVAGVCYLCAKRGHISGDCPGLKLGGPQNEAECMGSWCQSNVNMQNLPKLYEIRTKPILDPGATMHQWAGTGIWCRNTPKNVQKQQQKKISRSKRNRNWQGSRHKDVEAVNQLFGANKVEIKHKTLEALRPLRQADHALDKIFKYLADRTEYV
jgi:hypothetical protein